MTVDAPVTLVSVFKQYSDLRIQLEDAKKMSSELEKVAKLSKINSACVVLDEQLNDERTELTIAHDREKQTPTPVSWWTSSKTGLYAGGGCLAMTVASLVASFTTHFARHPHLSAAWLLPAAAGAAGLYKISSSMRKDFAAETQKSKNLFNCHHKISTVEFSLSMFDEVKAELLQAWDTLPVVYQAQKPVFAARTASGENLQST